MTANEKTKFLERIISISRSYTTSYFSSETTKLLWMYFIFNSIFILSYQKLITIKELTLLSFNFEMSLNQVSILTSLASLTLLIKIFLNIKTDRLNKKYELELNNIKFSELVSEVRYENSKIKQESLDNLFKINEKHKKLSQKFLKYQSARRVHEDIDNNNPQHIDIANFLEARYNFITSTLKKTNCKNDIIVTNTLHDIMNIEKQLDKLSILKKSEKKIRNIDYFSNLTLPVLSTTYTFYILFIHN